MDSELGCLDCGVDLHEIDEWYVLHDAVWDQAIGIHSPQCAGDPDSAHPHSCKCGVLCIGCVEQRLGRRLTPSDFDLSVPLNLLPFISRSTRLWARLSCA